MTEPKRRRVPNMTERLAAVLLKLRLGDGWLIPEHLRSSGTAKAIVGAVEWDHIVLHAHGGDTRPQNIDPMRKADHREKSRGDTTKAAKANRIETDQAEFRKRMLAKLQGDVDAITPAGRNPKKAKFVNRGFDKSRTKHFNGKVTER